MMVLPAPGSSANKNRSGWRGNISPYTAVIWWGSGSTSDVCTARWGSNRWASRMRRASDTRRRSSPSPLKLHGRPAAASSSNASRSLYSSSLPNRPVLSLYVSSTTESPNHLTSTTVTVRSGRIPLITASFRRSSRRNIAHRPFRFRFHNHCISFANFSGNPVQIGK